eukprot:3135297-Rhodomonas_salina.1
MSVPHITDAEARHTLPQYRIPPRANHAYPPYAMSVPHTAQRARRTIAGAGPAGSQSVTSRRGPGSSIQKLSTGQRIGP